MSDLITDDTKVRRLTVHGREFLLTEPDGRIIVRLLNVVGAVGVRATAQVRKAMQEAAEAIAKQAKAGGAEGEGIIKAGGLNPMTVLSILASLEEADLLKIGSAALQFKDEREGIRWLDKEGVDLNGILKALMFNIELSGGIVDTLAGFIAGLGPLIGTPGQ